MIRRILTTRAPVKGISNIARTQPMGGCGWSASIARLEQQAYREQFELEDTHWWFAGRRAVIWALLRRAGIPAGRADARRRLRDRPQPDRVRRAWAPPPAWTSPPTRSSSAASAALPAPRQGRLEALAFDDGVVRSHPRHRRARASRRRSRRDARTAARRRPGRAVAGHRARLPLAVEPARRRPPSLPPLHAALAARAAGRDRLADRSSPATSTRCCCRRSPLCGCSPAATPTRPSARTSSSPRRCSTPSLERPMRAEAGLIERGARLPAGFRSGSSRAPTPRPGA